MPTEKMPGVDAFFLDSGVSASQFCTAKTTATLWRISTMIGATHWV